MGWITLVAFAFVALVFIGLGVNGTLTAAVDGYQKVQSNPEVQHLESSAKTTLENTADAQLHNIENATASAIAQKVGGSV